jgi:hypothetical protein
MTLAAGARIGSYEIVSLLRRHGRSLSRDRSHVYVDATDLLMAVPVQTTPSFSAGNPARLFENRYLTPNLGRTYDVSSDGQRFLMIKSAAADRAAGDALPNIVVVLNWLEELKQRVPVK